MAKQQLRTYVFTPGAAELGTIEIPGKIDLNQITLITNVTRNVILYNFADTTYTGTTVTFNRANSTNFPTATQNGDGTTLITLAISTLGYSSSDNIQIFYERAEQITRPWPMGTDAFERHRMASPQSMLDADFEYGLQPTKWQEISTVRSALSIYEIPGTDYSLSSITTDASNLAGPAVESLITVVTTNPHNLSTGSAITVQNLDVTVSGFTRAMGTGIVNSVTNATTFNYYAKARVGTSVGQSLLVPATIIRKGGFYTNAGQTPTFSVSGSGASTTGTITLTYSTNHGLLPGDGIIVVISSDNGTNNNNLCQGPFYIASVPTPTTAIYQARNVGTITGTPVGTVYPRPDSFYQHRPIDGGVSLGAGGPNYGASAVRMSKKYIRYQSGKSINYNTAALFAPNYDISSVTATNTAIGSTITIATDDLDHGLQAGATIGLSGITTTGYNGTYTVVQVVDERTIQVTATNVLSSTTGALSFKPYIFHENWQGAVIRAGTYDDQNGMYFQYDGQYMAVGLRYSTQQVAGLCTVTPGSALVTGNQNASYNTQLIAGDRVVIRGMSHVVTAVTSSTQIYINPPYRGSTTSTGVKMSMTRDILVPQFQWNIDRCDGSNGPFNPSGYNLLPWKVQMVGIQWTWYGAGFIEWMLRGPDGNYLMVHRIKNSNVNTEAYMRSGNQPVRYEVQNEGWHTSLVQSIGTTDTAMTVTDITFFPPSGIVYVDNELISYSSKSTSTGQGQLLGLTRTAPIQYYINGALQTFTATNVAAAHTSGTGVISVGVTATPTISHWGSAFLTDGGFDQDRGYIFNYQSPNITVSTVKKTAFAIRLAPSVSNAVTGDLGARDLINRAQLLLQTIENTVGGGSGGQQAVVIEGVINPSNYPNTVTNITWFPLQGTVAGGNILGSGQPSFTQVAPSSYINFDGTATYTTALSNTATIGSIVLSVVSTASMSIGDAVVTTVPSFSGGSGIPGNCLIQSIGAGQVTVTQPILSQLSSATSLTFYRNFWAVPGETIFSFISSPSNKDSLDLTPLKELTNTPLGGRGTYPNGPDTLFINVYLTSGPSLQTNLVLRWGEAQA
jgi:hypothetical protein